MNFGSRLREARKKLGLSQEEFGRRIGVSYAQVSRIELGENLPSGGLRKSIETVAGISLHWLDTGEGDWRAKIQEGAAEASPPWGPGTEDGGAAELLTAWGGMSSEGQRQVLDFVRFLVEKEKIGKKAKK